MSFTSTFSALLRSETDAQLMAQTPLHKAALRGHLDVCRFLLSRQVNVNAADNDGWTVS